MRHNLLLALLLLGTGIVAIGCGCGGGGGDDKVLNSTHREMDDLHDLAVKAKGKWKALTPEEQKKLIDNFGGNEDTAKKMFKMSFAPPNAKPHLPPKKAIAPKK